MKFCTSTSLASLPHMAETALSGSVVRARTLTSRLEACWYWPQW